MAKVETECSCNNGWVCKEHPDNPWGHEGCGAAGEVGLNPQCDKDPDSMFLSVHCEVQPGRRKPPVRKTQLPTSRAVTTGIVGATLLILSIFASSRVLAGANLKVLVPHHSVGIIRERETLRPHGSGFLLDDVNYMVTAWHVVFDKSTHLQRKLVFQPMTRLGIHDPAPFLEMKPYFLSEERDIAVMRLEGKNLAKEPLVRGNAASLRPGDMVGYGGLNLRDSILTFTLSGDSITNIFTKGDLRFLEIRGIAIPGFSGGPLFGGGETVVGIILRGDIPADPDGKSRFEAATVEQIPQFVSTGKKPK